MKRLLAILGVVGLSVTTTTTVVSCNVKDRFTEKISSIEKKLKLLLYSKTEIAEPWEKEKLEKAIIDQKIDKAGGISVDVGKPISPGANTQFEQKITFIGNGKNENNFTYSGKITIAYAYGENLPPGKIKITKNDVESSIASLKDFLEGTTFNNKELVQKIFKSNRNMPGAPTEGIMFGEVINLTIENFSPASNGQKDYQKNRETVRFSFEANVGLKDDEQYKFASDVDNGFRKFEGKMLMPIIINEQKITELSAKIKQQAQTWIFLDINVFRNEIKTKIENITFDDGILYDSLFVKKIEGDAQANKSYWNVEIELTLKPNVNLGYEFGGNDIRKITIPVSLLSLRNIDNTTLSWKLFEQKNGKMLINPQFINFGKVGQNFLEDQGNYLIKEKLTSKWGRVTENPVSPNEDPWENANKESTGYNAKMNFVSKLLNSGNVLENHLFVEKHMKYTTAFNYEKDFNLQANDKALFFNENDINFEANIKAKLDKTGSLSELQEQTTIITNTSLSGKEYYHMILLSKNKDGAYKTSSKVFRVRLESIKL
ncbi:hypothetical protein CXP39_01420 [Mesoplasma syrphidae]|uniref:Uncharacterized protein n=1 Tax=Mesoplasma syrphidae TaxID=225999 RepID=A0A2K9C1W1_9MOLU|nr:lipoprotein [Mesoplasma syrphidae]AUF83459.1 hypothetical protein CXP39_01420 [Mesoplasma syrphidae]